MSLLPAHLASDPVALERFLSSLPKADRDLLDAAIESEERDKCEASLAYFVKKGWKSIEPSDYSDNWHIDAICEHLEAVVRGELRHGIINQPPRTTKSLITSIFFPAWVWAQKRKGPLSGPQVKFFCASYGETLSFDIAIMARRLIESEWYQRLWGHRFKLATDQNAKGKFDTTEGGYRISTSVEAGRTTGQGGDVIIIDDPHNTQKTESEAEIDKVLRWWDRALPTRLNNQNTGVFIVVMQRQRENDLTGHILETLTAYEEWWHLMFPMRFEVRRKCSTILGYEDPRTEEGELLWPERFPENTVDVLERKLGPYGTSGQLQQSPEPAGGGIIKRDWWQVFPPLGEERNYTITRTYKAGDRYVTRDELSYPDFEYVVASLDPAYTSKKENDYSALTVFGLWRRYGVPKLMLMAGWQKRLDIHGNVEPREAHEELWEYLERVRPKWGLTEWVGHTCRRFAVDKLLVEGGPAGQAIAQEIRRLFGNERWSTQLVKPKGDKIARAYAVQHLFSEGMIYAPDRDWAEEVIGECARFPKGEHDDIPDSVTQALKFMRDAGWAIKAEEKKFADADAAMFRGNQQPLYDV